MANTQECVCESHTSHGSCVSHVLTGNRIINAGDSGIISSRQVLEDELEGLECKTVGVRSSHNGSISLEAVCNCVDTGSGGQTSRAGSHHISVNDSHLRHQLIVSQRVLNACILIGDNRERSNLGTSTSRSRNSDEVSLLAHVREGVNSLTDIDEAHCHIHKVSLGVLIQDPHDLTSVHCRTTADSDDAVRLELSHSLCALLCGSQGRIRLNVRECGVDNAHLIKSVSDSLGEATLVQEGVSYDEHSLLAHNVLELLKSNRKAALLDINLLRCTEPQHILSPLGNGLNIQQVLNTDILGNGVAAPRTAAQCEGRSKLEVVEVADTTEGRRSVNDKTASLHSLCPLVELLSLGVVVDPKNGSMTKTAVVSKQCISHIQSLVEVLGLVHTEDSGELLVTECFVGLEGSCLTDDDLNGLGDLEACHLSDLVRTLTNDLSVKSAVDEHNLSDHVSLLLVEEHAASLLEFLLDIVVDGLVNDKGLLGCADHTVIEGLGVNDGVNCINDISRRIDNSGSVTCTNADSRCTGGVSSLNHSRTAGRENDVNFLHEEVGQVEGGNIYPGNDAVRSASLNSCLVNDLSSLNGALLCTGVRADDDTISGLERDEGLEYCSGGRVSCRDNRTNYADRLCDLFDTVSFIALDNSAGLCVLVCIVDVLCCIVILDNLILDNTVACFLNSHLCKRDSLLVGCGSCCEEYCVYLLLCVGRENLLCFLDFLKSSFKALYAVNHFVKCHCHLLLKFCIHAPDIQNLRYAPAAVTVY